MSQPHLRGMLLRDADLTPAEHTACEDVLRACREGRIRWTKAERRPDVTASWRGEFGEGEDILLLEFPMNYGQAMAELAPDNISPELVAQYSSMYSLLNLPDSDAFYTSRKHGVTDLRLSRDLVRELASRWEYVRGASLFKEQGNRQYMSGKPKLAAASFSKAIDQQDLAMTEWESKTTTDVGDHPVCPQLGAVLLACLSNRAQCYLDLKEYRKALADCDDAEALRLSLQSVYRTDPCTDPVRMKLSFRAAQALEALGEAEEARQRLEVARASGLISKQGDEMLAQLASQVQA